ncbi:hypothetical protein BDS110ZK14_12360 [Bradyrhizobium diazoefficiens]|nr:hypothetical protein XF15B_62930 [Bradyrhizobium diazoefficiens]
MDKIDSEANRRTITVLFADLSGFTAMSERLDPEVMQTLQNGLFEELTAAVQSFGGFVDKFIGDALLALFGAPAAHEDDPERAVRAALDMIDRTARLSERAKAYAGSPLLLHVGINTGHVVAGGLGAGVAKSYSVTGDTVNTAQRLQSMAAPGEVLVGPLTHRLTRHAFSYDSLGEVSLKGKMGSVLVHRLNEPLDTPRAARGLDTLGLNAPLIGRDAELARMIGSLDLACGGAAQLVRLVGEAGIGKTRLVREFVARIRDQDRFAGVAIRQAACSPLGEQSYGTLAAVLRSAYGIAQKAGATEAEAKVAEALSELGLATDEADRLMPLYLHVLGLGDPNAVLRHVEPEQLRRQIFFAIRTVFERRLALSPLLIIVEDLHWADAVSLEALRFLMDRLERTRLMLLFTHRPMLELDLFGSSRISHATLRLPPLGDADGQRLLAAYFSHGWREPPGRLFSRILDRAGGNPLFLEEIIRGLIEAGTLERDGVQWRMTSDEAAADIPASIQALLLARLDRLPHQVRRLAQEAAVIGPRFDAAALGAAATEPARVEAGLELLCDAEIVEEIAGSNSISLRTYRFTQTMLQDVIYQNLLLQRRIELHGRIGGALERLYGHEPERLEDLILLGHHFSLSASKPKGARYLRAAGDRARASYANDDAIRLYQQASPCCWPAANGSRNVWSCTSGSRTSVARLAAGTRPRSTIRARWRGTAPYRTGSAKREFFASLADCCGTPASGSRQRRITPRRPTCLEGSTRPSSGRISCRSAAVSRFGRAITWPPQDGQTRRSAMHGPYRRTRTSREGSRRHVPLRRPSTPRGWRWRGLDDTRRRCARWSRVLQPPKQPASST